MGTELVVQQQVETPKSPMRLFELPCGYLDDQGQLHTEVTVREITGDEEDMLVSPKVPGTRKMSELMVRCVERIGTFTEKKDIIRLIPELVVGDRVFLLFAIRRATLGDDFPFEEQCPHCSETYPYNFDLTGLEVKKMPDPKKRIFDVTLPKCGKVVRFHPMTGKDEVRLEKATKGTDSASASILLRLDMLDGKPPELVDVKKLGLQDRQFLRDRFEEIEGGVETTIQVACQGCGKDFDREVRVDDRGFFFPSEIQKSWSQKYST